MLAPWLTLKPISDLASHRKTTLIASCIVGGALLLTLALPIRGYSQNSSSEPAPKLSLVDRSIRLEQTKGRGATERFAVWVLEYRLRIEAKSEIRIPAAEVSATLEAWVANSAVPGHSVPRKSSLTFESANAPSAVSEIIESPDESRKCREHGALAVWTEPAAERDDAPGAKPSTPEPSAKPAPQERIAQAKTDAAVERAQAIVNPSILVMPPRGLLRVRLRLEHRHDLFGAYDPLLGTRELELRVGPMTFHDQAALDRIQGIPAVEENWSFIPVDRRDDRVFVSPPDCLHLEAHVPGNQSFRFPDRSIRRGTRMRLSYYYMIAPGSQGDCRARLAQYRDTPTSWKVLDEGTLEQDLKVIGRWVKVERIIKVEREATAVALEFRINSCEIGEAWIDDVSLEPIDEITPAGP